MPGLWPKCSFFTTLRRTPPRSIATITRHTFRLPKRYGLRSYVISNGPVQALAGIAPHLVAILHFDSLADLNAAFASPEGQAAAADLSNFASAGATLLIYDSKAV